EKRARVTGLDPLVGQELLDVEGKLEETDRVRDVRTRDPDPIGELLLLESQFLEQLPEGLGELDRTKVLTMDVLDQRLSQGVAVVAVADYHGDRGQTRQPGGAETSFPGDQLVGRVTRSANDHRLKDPDLPDRRRQRLDRLVIEARPRLTRVRSDRVQRNLQETARPLAGLGRAGDQRRQPSTQPPTFRHHSPPLRNSRQRRRRGASSFSSVAPIPAAAASPDRSTWEAAASDPSDARSSSSSSSITTTRRGGRCPGGTGARGGVTRASGVRGSATSSHKSSSSI